MKLSKAGGGSFLKASAGAAGLETKSDIGHMHTAEDVVDFNDAAVSIIEEHGLTVIEEDLVFGSALTEYLSLSGDIEFTAGVYAVSFYCSSYQAATFSISSNNGSIVEVEPTNGTYKITASDDPASPTVFLMTARTPFTAARFSCRGGSNQVKRIEVKIRKLF